jgi:hypothetical protein
MKNRKLFSAAFMLAAVFLMQLAFTASAARPSVMPGPQATKFKVRIENISTPDGQRASDGTNYSFALSPGMFMLSSKKAPLFKEGKRASKGLEMQAEDGDPSGLVKSLEMANHSSNLHGVYNTPIGAGMPGPIRPGEAYEFSFEAVPGMTLYLTMMNGQSNDWFYAPDESGIELFHKNGHAISGDITGQLILWNAGTEADEELGIGPNQGPRQKATNTGPEENGVVGRVRQSVYYNKTAQLFRVTLMPESNTGM